VRCPRIRLPSEERVSPQGKRRKTQLSLFFKKGGGSDKSGRVEEEKSKRKDLHRETNKKGDISLLPRRERRGVEGENYLFITENGGTYLLLIQGGVDSGGSE